MAQNKISIYNRMPGRSIMKPVKNPTSRYLANWITSINLETVIGSELEKVRLVVYPPPP
jgi:hypothetical protein